MNRGSLFLSLLSFLGAVSCVFSCVRQPESVSIDTPVVSLLFSPDGVSKVDALPVGAEVGVFARVEGRGDFSLANHKFTANNTGILLGDPAAYYPDADQATYLYACYPYLGVWNDTQGSWRTPTDQTALADARQADLLWGSAVTTPSAEAVPITFAHLLSQVVVEVSGQTVDRLVLHEVLTDGSLSIETGVLGLGSTRRNVAVTGRNELIVAGQPISRLTVGVSGSNYILAPTTPIEVAPGQRTTLHLTLHQAAGSSQVVLDRVAVGDWSTAQGLGGIQQGVCNDITAHWLLPHPDFTNTAKANLKVKSTDGRSFTLPSTTFTYDPTSSSTVGQCTFSISGPEELTYPFRVESVDFLRSDGSLVQSCSTLLAQGIYRSGAVALGIYQDNILVVSSEPITDWTPETIDGAWDNYKYTGNTFQVKVIDPSFDYKKIAKVRFSIWGGAAEWTGVSFVQDKTYSNFVLKSPDFGSGNEIKFPTSNGYTPATRYYPIEWVELVDASNNYLYRGYCNVEVTEGGQILLVLIRQGKVLTGSSITAPIPTRQEGTWNGIIPFVDNSFLVRFIDPDFISDLRPAVHTLRMGVAGTGVQFAWKVSIDRSNPFMPQTALSFPDDAGNSPKNQFYTILWVDAVDASGGYLYRSYCGADITRNGSYTLDLHQRGQVNLKDATSISAPAPTEGQANPDGGKVRSVFNTFYLDFSNLTANADIAKFTSTNTVKITCSDGYTYTWSIGTYISNYNNYVFLRSSPSFPAHQTTNPDASQLRPLTYPFTVTRAEVYNGATLLLSKNFSVEVSARGTTVFLPMQ